MRVWVVGFCGLLSQLAFAQGEAGFRVAWGCSAPVERVVCLEPSGLAQVGVGGVGGAAWEAGLALGGRLRAESLVEGVGLRAELGLWYDSAVQIGLFEAYGEVGLGEFGLSAGKRRLYGGPWDDTLMGRDGRWGLFGRYGPAALPWLGVELAYLPNAGLAGGQGFVGARAGLFELGTLVELVRIPDGLGGLQPSLAWNPRVGLAGRDVALFWQSDRGFWGEVGLPLPLGQALSLAARCPCDPETQAWVERLDRSRAELLVWWNPEWDYLGENSPFLPEDRLLAWLTQPRKFLAGAAYSWDGRLRLGLEVSRAPVEAVRVYLRLHFP